MKYYFIVVLLIIYHSALSQKALLTTDTTIAIPKLNFDANGQLVIAASPTSSNSDFNFLNGKWIMYHRRLNKRLENCKDWTEFKSTDSNYNILSGTANMDIYSTTEMPGMEGKLFEGATVRLFDPKTKLWSLYWVASNRGVLDPPVVGSFKTISAIFSQKTLLMASQ